MKISCNTESTKAGFNNVASFEIEKGLSEYHPISFLQREQRGISSGAINKHKR